MKLGFTEKEVGHMTLRKWGLLYKAYKGDFDLELTLKTNQLRYEDLEKEETLDEAIPF